MTPTELMTKRVLAIDDDETILGVMNNVLKMHDYEAETASQWVEALDAFNERPPDLLLLDLQMPHVDGIFLLEWIREQEFELPVIVVSAYLDDDSVARFKSLGVNAFV
jgi:CheY-like chemotaxis protein